MIVQPFNNLRTSFIIRSDANASNVTLAIPGTRFDNVFAQNSNRSDIAGYINGALNSIPDLPVTGSNLSISTVTRWTDAFDGYGTSMQNGAATNLGSIPGGQAIVNFGTSPFTVEGWINRVSGNTYFHAFFNYNNGCGFVSHNAGTWRILAQNSTAGETFRDATLVVTNGEWYHWFLSRDASFWYGGINGTIRARLTLAGATGTTAAFEIAGRVGIGGGDPIRTQDFRVTKGICRYSGTEGSAYTVPPSTVTRG